MDCDLLNKICGLLSILFLFLLLYGSHLDNISNGEDI